MHRSVFLLALVVFVPRAAEALDNGLALKPPMGWLNRDGRMCNIDCDKDPNNCVSERLYMQIADVMVKDGWKEAGYEYVCIHNCWSSQQRNAQGRLQADPKRFPGGIKKLADYVHALGLKLGIYGGVGSKTCDGYPGSLGHYETDAQTFADWGVDLLHFDGCYMDWKNLGEGYVSMSKELTKIGARIVFSCEWPLNEWPFKQPEYKAIHETCHQWHNHQDFYDVNGLWNSIKSILEWTASHQDLIVPSAGPGGWNHPDVLMIGNFGLTHEQQETQMALWAIMAAPLLMSNDLGRISPRSKELLQNKHVIAINQDPLGKQGSRTAQVNNFEVWERPLSDNQLAIAVFNKLETGGPREFSIRGAPGWKICSPLCKVTIILPQYKEMGVRTPETSLVVFVNPSGTALLTVTPIRGDLTGIHLLH